MINFLKKISNHKQKLALVLLSQLCQHICYWKLLNYCHHLPFTYEIFNYKKVYPFERTTAFKLNTLQDVYLSGVLTTVAGLWEQHY